MRRSCPGTHRNLSEPSGRLTQFWLATSLLDDWLAAASLALGDTELDEIAETIKRLDTGGGPEHPNR